jgi:RluA family pseudouridine synthase
MPLVTAEYSSIVHPSHNGQKIIDYLVSKFAYQSKEEWVSKLKLGLMTVDGSQVEPNFKLQGKEKLTLRVDNFDEPEVDTTVERINCLGELHIVGKPTGVPIHRTGRILVHTYTNNVKKALGTEVWPLHRLDKETSGLMLYSSSKSFCKKHQSKMYNLLRRKIYMVLVEGEFTGSEIIDTPIAQNVGGSLRARMVATPIEQGGKESKTKVVDVCKITSKNGKVRTLVLCEIFTGRKHQIRVHLESIGYPIVGDKIYGTDGKDYEEMCESGLSKEEVQKRFKYPHQMLHSLSSEIHLEGSTFWVRSECLSDAFKNELNANLNWTGLLDEKLVELQEGR